MLIYVKWQSSLLTETCRDLVIELYSGLVPSNWKLLCSNKWTSNPVFLSRYCLRSISSLYNLGYGYFVPGSSRIWSHNSEMSHKGLIYSFVAKGSVVLAEHTSFSGNFSTIAVQCLQKLPSSSSKYTYSCDGHTFNFLLDNGFGKYLLTVPALAIKQNLDSLSRACNYNYLLVCSFSCCCGWISWEERAFCFPWTSESWFYAALWSNY